MIFAHEKFIISISIAIFLPSTTLIFSLNKYDFAQEITSMFADFKMTLPAGSMMATRVNMRAYLERTAAKAREHVLQSSAKRRRFAHEGR